MRAFVSIAIVGFAILQSPAAERPASTEPPAPAQPGIGERVGESVDRGLSTLGQRIRKTWADFRRSVDELSVQGRVYARLHWDKSLANAPIEISVQNENVVTLSGTVANDTAHLSAITLAENTVGVGKVVDHLSDSTTPPPTTPPSPTTPPTTSLPAVPPQK